MRITGGEARGRLIAVPDGAPVRPTASKVRQAFFNILGNKTGGASFLDLCAGSGLMGMEALSRGARQLIFVEQDRKAAKAIETNLLKLSFQAEVICQDLRKVLPILDPGAFDLIFADPPYKSDLSAKILELVERHQLLAPEGLLVIEHLKSSTPAESCGKLKRSSIRTYGQTSLSFYSFSEAD